MSLFDLENFHNEILPEDAHASICHLILTHLVYNCYEQTANQFAAALCMGKPETTSPLLEYFKQPLSSHISQNKQLKQLKQLKQQKMLEMVQSLPHRKELLRLVRNGQTLQAIQFCHAHFPNLIIDPKTLSQKQSVDKYTDYSPLSISFMLHCQHFIELVREEKQADALLYAQTVLSPFGTAFPSYLDKLRDVAALIAYENPIQSPVGHFLSQKRREDVANCLNCSLILYYQLPPVSSLEKVISHLSSVVREYELGKDSKKKVNKLWSLKDVLK